MRVAQMLDNLGWGGAQSMQLFLVESLQPLGIELTVISLNDLTDTTMPTRLKEAGARVVSFPFPRLFSPGSFAGLVHFLRREKFDLLHAYLVHSNIIGSIAGSLSSTPVISSLRNTHSKRTILRVSKEKLETFAMRHFSQRVLANGNAVAESAHVRLGDSVGIDIIPNAVDQLPAITAEERQCLRREMLGDPERLLILSVGRVVPAKGYPDLIRAFSEARRRNPAAVLAIAGGGYGDSYISEIRTLIDELGLNESVRLLGEYHEVPRLLSIADLYVNSSLWEGTPVSVLEAMSAGLPIVATAVGENPFLLSAGAGVVVPPNQPAQLATAISELLDLPEKRAQLGKVALDRVAKEYNRQLWCQRLLQLYGRITPKAKPYLDKFVNGRAD